MASATSWASSSTIGQPGRCGVLLQVPGQPLAGSRSAATPTAISLFFSGPQGAQGGTAGMGQGLGCCAQRRGAAALGQARQNRVAILDQVQAKLLPPAPPAHSARSGRCSRHRRPPSPASSWGGGPPKKTAALPGPKGAANPPGRPGVPAVPSSGLWKH